MLSSHNFTSTSNSNGHLPVQHTTVLNESPASPHRSKGGKMFPPTCSHFDKRAVRQENKGLGSLQTHRELHQTSSMLGSGHQSDGWQLHHNHAHIQNNNNNNSNNNRGSSTALLSVGIATVWGKAVRLASSQLWSA